MSTETPRPFSTTEITLRILGIFAAILGGVLLSLMTLQPEFLLGGLGLAGVLVPVRAPRASPAWSADGLPLPMDELIAGGRPPALESEGLPRYDPPIGYEPQSHPQYQRPRERGLTSPFESSVLKVKPVERRRSVQAGARLRAHQPKQRCPYCRAGLHSHEEIVLCAGCSTVLHQACQIESGEACLTLGCSERVARLGLEVAS